VVLDCKASVDGLYHLSGQEAEEAGAAALCRRCGGSCAGPARPKLEGFLQVLERAEAGVGEILGPLLPPGEGADTGPEMVERLLAAFTAAMDSFMTGVSCPTVSSA
jgi:hypothetical protein